MAIAVAAALGMGVLSALGSLREGSTANAIAQMNAGVATTNASQARYAAREEAANIRRQSAYTVAAQKVAVGASGIYVNSGTASDFRTATEDQFELDALKALYNGELQATAFERQADIYRYTGKVAKKNSYFAAGFGLFNSGLGAYNAVQYAKTPMATNMSVVGGGAFNPYVSGNAIGAPAGTTPSM